MIPIWQAVIAALITGGIGCFVGMAIMACAAVAHDYDREQAGREP